MWIMFFGLVSGLFATCTAQQQVKSRSCSFAGVFHVEGNDRYSLTFEEAAMLCEHLSASLASLDQVTKAHKAGLQTCRYGWINSTQVIIVRHKAVKNCAANQIGVLIMSSAPERNRSDAFCYADKDWSLKKNCTAEIRNPTENKSDSDFDNNSFLTDKPSTEEEDHENSTSTEDTSSLSDSELTTLSSWTKTNDSTEVVGVEATTGMDLRGAVLNRGTSGSDEKDRRSTPDWLIILIVVLAVLLILLVCVAVATRKSWCGKKKTLVITAKSINEGNGTAVSFTQEQEKEMVTLMNSEKNNSEFVNMEKSTEETLQA